MAISPGRYLRPGAFASSLAAVAAGTLLAACGSSTAASPSTTASPATTEAPTTTAAPTTTIAPQNVSLQLDTESASGSKAGYPKFIPGDVTIHQGSPVTLTITSVDDGPAPLPASLATYETIQGGTETVDGKAVTSVPNANISHTYSVPDLGINVLIPAVPSGAKSTTVTFTFTPTKTGTFTWHCFAPCGDGTDGMGGAMATMGQMEGNITVS
ncbi:MAG: hypothetical protein HKL84_06460 [Acidimicrobiaceae bacterium]|nr:hypothetical protein [Acidimicrobiaceae bacterium]